MKIAINKLIILSVFIVGLVLLTLWLFDAIKGYEGESIKPDPFKPVAMSAISQRIEGKDYRVARNAFDSIYQMIDIQGNLLLKDGSRPTSVAEIDSLKLLAYNTAVKSLIDKADTLFQSSIWDRFPLEDMKSHASYYKEIFPQNNFYEPNLMKIINCINDYRAALKACRNAGSITTVAGIQQLEKKVKEYKRYPLTNDTELNSLLNSAVQKAKNSVSESIDRRATSLKNGVTYFSSEADFTERYNSINNTLTIFVKNYGNNSSTNSARAILTSAKYEAEHYFSTN